MNALAALRSRVILLTLAFGLWPALAFGQSTAQPVVIGTFVTSGCPGGASVCWVPVDGSNPLAVNATVTASATINGFTQTGHTGAVAVSSTTSRTAFPTSDTTVILTNTGAKNLFYAVGTTGVVATTGSTPLAAGGFSCFDLTAGQVDVAAITAGSDATTLDIQSGTGFCGGAAGPTGSSASGGGSSGAVFGPTAAGSAAANPPVLTGGTIDGTATGNVSVQKVVGGVASDNTAQVNGVTVLTGAGATGTGSPRDTVAQDTSTVAGAAPLTTGLYVTGPSAAALATSALQTTGNTSLGTIATASAAQATAANQTSVIGTKAPGTAAASSVLGGGVYTSAGITLTTGQQAGLQLDSTGHLLTTATGGGGGAVTAASGAFASGSIASGAIVQGGDVTEGTEADSAYAGSGGTTVIGALKGIYSSVNGVIPTQAGTVSIGGVGILPTTSGGASTYSNAVTTTVLAADAGAGQLYGWYIGNTNTSDCFLQFFDLATGSVTLGTSTPKLSLDIPAGAAANVSVAQGLPFATAISIAAATARAGASACTNSLSVNLFYK